MGKTTDEQLMQGYALGDSKAFDRLYQRHRGHLYRYLYRQLNDKAMVNDLYQGVWEKIIRARDHYRPSTPFTPWLFRIAHNHLVDYYRRSKPAVTLAEETRVDPQTGPAQSAISQQQNGQLLNTIAALPREQKDALLLQLECGLKLEEIASVTGVSRETVKSRLRYAVNKLKLSLAE